jgi:hypothetical protein
VLAGLVGGVLAQCLDQHVGGEQVVAHRHERLIWPTWQPRRVGRLLQERLDLLPVGGGLDHAEGAGLLAWHRNAGHRGARATVEVLRDHLPRVHAVDVVGAEHDDQIRLLVVDQVQ